MRGQWWFVVGEGMQAEGEVKGRAYQNSSKDIVPEWSKSNILSEYISVKFIVRSTPYTSFQELPRPPPITSPNLPCTASSSLATQYTRYRQPAPIHSPNHHLNSMRIEARIISIHQRSPQLMLTQRPRIVLVHRPEHRPQRISLSLCICACWRPACAVACAWCAAACACWRYGGR